jgi:hypothetical protein
MQNMFSISSMPEEEILEVLNELGKYNPNARIRIEQQMSEVSMFYAT